MNKSRKVFNSLPNLNICKCINHNHKDLTIVST